MYNVESLKGGIQQAKINIKAFEAAIEKEKNTIKEYRQYIKDIKAKEQFESEMIINVEVDRD